MAESLLFFDLDDTLVDHGGAETSAQAATYESERGRFGSVALPDWLAAYRKHNLSLWAAYGRGELTREEIQLRRFVDPLAALGLATEGADAMGDFYLARYRESWRLNDGAEDLLEAASRLGTVGLLSNGFREQQQGKVRRFRLDRWAKVVVLSEDVGAMKPSRQIFDAAWKQANGGAPARKVYLGDSFETDVVGAKSAGWFPILYWPDGSAPPAPVVYVRRLLDAVPLLS